MKALIYLALIYKYIFMIWLACAMAFGMFLLVIFPVVFSHKYYQSYSYGLYYNFAFVACWFLALVIHKRIRA